MEALKIENETTSPRIYVACLAAYNAGKLHGAWIDLDGKDAADIWAEVEAMLEASPIPDAEEWAIHDYEGFGGIGLSESEDLDDLPDLVEAIEENPESYPIYVGLVGREYASPEGFQDAYHGCWDSAEDFAADLVENSVRVDDLPDLIRYHIDYEGIARDLKCDGWAFEQWSEGVHVFANY